MSRLNDPDLTDLDRAVMPALSGTEQKDLQDMVKVRVAVYEGEHS